MIALPRSTRCLLFSLLTAGLVTTSPGQDHSKVASLVAYPKDHPGDVYPELKIYDAHHQPVRTPKEDWTAAAAHVTHDQEWGKWLQSRRAAMDEWMEKRRDKVEWSAGWWHNFVSPKDGSQIIFTPDEPGENTLQSATDPQIALTPKLHDAWVFSFRSAQATKLLEAARLYRLTNDRKYADWAAGGLDFYADNYLKWRLDDPAHLGKNTSRLMGQPLDEAVDLIRYVQTARTLGSYVDPARKKRWIDELFKPDAALLQQTTLIIHNIACWQRAAGAEVALYCGDEALWKQVIDGPWGIHDQILHGVTSDYLWYEQSIHYNEYVVRALSPFFTDALVAGRGAELQADMESVENLMLTPTAMRFANGQTPNPADGGKAERVPPLQFWAEVAPLFPTPTGVYQLAHDKSWAALFDPPAPATIPAEPPVLPPVVSRNFDSSRMAVLRNGPWQVYFHYGQLNQSHAQAEALNFEAFYNDTDVTQDPGTVGYGSAMHKGYYQTGVCHNVPLVDGVGQVGWNPGKLERFSPGSVSASQPLYQPKTQASRTLTTEGDQLKDEVRIATNDGKPHDLGFLLQVTGKVEALPANFIPDPDPAKIQPGPGFGYWKDAAHAVFHDRASFNVRLDKTTLRVSFELPGEFTLWHATAPDLPPARRDVFYLQTHGTDATLKTSLQPAAR